MEWNDAGVEGANRFLKRVWTFSRRVAEAPAGTGAGTATGDAAALRFELHTLLRQVSYDYERMQYNTVVSGAMKMLNALEAFKGEAAAAQREGYALLLRVLYPACPHITWVLWRDLGFASELGDLLDAPWPPVDEAALVQDQIELVLQVNGKMRGALRVAASAERTAIEAAALASPDFAKFAEGRAPKKIIVVPGRLVNVVV
jgi:leucyl-tRNA synthetase